MSADTVIVVPCFNEADRLDVHAFERYASTTDGVRFLFVNDGSTDATEAVLDQLCDRVPRVLRHCALPRNAGKGEAVRSGMTVALADAPAYVGYWDADLSTPLEQIAAFRSILDERPDLVLVVGSRVRRLGANVRRSAIRHYLGRLFATAASLVLGLPVYDTQCGAKVFRVGDDVRALFAEPFLSRWAFDVELFAKLAAVRAKRGLQAADAIYEAPLPAWRDVAGSKLRARHMVGAVLDLLAIRRAYR